MILVGVVNYHDVGGRLVTRKLVDAFMYTYIIYMHMHMHAHTYLHAHTAHPSSSPRVQCGSSEVTLRSLVLHHCDDNWTESHLWNHPRHILRA